MAQPHSDVKRSSWRDLYQVHPAADCFPMMEDPELDALAEDIKTHGLREHVKFWRPPGGGGPLFVLDGRNRLEAMARLGGTFHAADATCGPNGPHVKYSDGTACYFGSWQEGENPDPAAYVISLNIKRRHLTKEQQAELILKAVDASATFDRAKNDRAKVARSFSPTSGKKGGSTKDTILAKAVSEAAKHGISKRTVQNARAKIQGKHIPQKDKRPGVSVTPPTKPSEPPPRPSFLGPRLGVPFFLDKVKPIVEALEAEGRKNMATISPATVAHLTFNLKGYLERLTRDTTLEVRAPRPF